MKQLIIFGLAGIGAWALFQWWQQHRVSPAVSGAHNDPGAVQSAVAPPGLYSGVPEFDIIYSANGHGDQVAAAYHDNQMATLPGAFNYSPAFGPQENRADGGEIGVY